MTIGTFVSSLLVGPLSSKVGRRGGLWAAAILNAISTSIMLGTTSVGALYVARLILGMLSPGHIFFYELRLMRSQASPSDGT